MAFVHGASTRLFLNEKHISGQTSSFSVSYSMNLAETTNLLAGGTTSIPGLIEGSIEMEGFFEAQTADYTEIQDVMRAASVTTTAGGAKCTALPAGLVLGRPAFITKANPSSFEIESEIDEAVTLSFEADGEEGVDWGVVVQPHETETASTDHASVHDVDDASTNGGVAILHVTAVSGTTPSATIKVQHSVDDAVWVDLVTFTAATDETSEHVTVATGTTVNEFIRSKSTITGTSPSFTYLLAFARR